MERETGIEPALSAWKAEVLPLNYSRTARTSRAPSVLRFAGLHAPRTARRLGGGRWIRTTEGVSQQIYSLPPLAAWVSLRKEPAIFRGVHGQVKEIPIRLMAFGTSGRSGSADRADESASVGSSARPRQAGSAQAPDLPGRARQG